MQGMAGNVVQPEEQKKKKSATATPVISPCDLLLADMLCWPLLTLSAIAPQ